MVYCNIMTIPGGAPPILGKSITKLLNYLPIQLSSFKLKVVDLQKYIIAVQNLKAFGRSKFAKRMNLKNASKMVLVSLLDFSKSFGARMVSNNSNESNLIAVNQILTGKKPKINLNQKIPPSLKLNLGKFSTSSDSNKSSCEKLGCHLYHEEVMKAVNKQILDEFNACYAYLSMACYFARSDVALPGCQGFFMRMHEEEHGHALKLINFQTLRGANVKLYPIHAPECQDWECIEKALAVSLDMEKLVKENLIELHTVASKHNDLSTMDLIESQFMEDQERSICEIARLLKRLVTMGTSGLAEYLFDKEMHKIFVTNTSNRGIAITPPKPEYYL